jgi:phenylpyruvate tautomerase PptA (4-oxalocrotonate tautomerase family)
MPTLIIKTNVEVAPGRRKVLMEAFSAAVSEQLGKPERYVMVVLEGGRDMLFGADDAPAAYLELKSLGLPEDQTPALSQALCALLDRHFGIPAQRIYIEFASPLRHLFGWNGGTF